MITHLFLVIACLAIFFVIYPADAIPWTSEENKALDADAIAVGQIGSYRDDGAHRYYEISVIKWIKNPQLDQTITMRSITPQVFDPHVPYTIFEKKDLGLFYVKLIDGEWRSTYYSKQIFASEQNQTIYNMKKLVGNNNPDSSVSLERVCKEGHVLIQKYDGSPACVKPETVSKLVTREWGMSDNWIKISNVNKAINYQIDNAKITSIQAFSEHKNPSLQEEFKQTWLKINLESKQDGSLKITLPRNLIDSKIGHTDDGFFVLLDGTETEYQETETESERILNFSIPAKTDIIEIIGYDYYNPELNQFEIIKKNINQIGYEICDIRLEENKIIIHLNWIFEGSPQEEKIISKIPPYVEYEIIYHEGHSDYFISTITSHNCE